MNQRLARIARIEAEKDFHGTLDGQDSNLKPIVSLFPVSPTWNEKNWDNSWCAAFVYYCFIVSGIELPVKYPSELVATNFSGCYAWEEWAKLEGNGYWHDPDEEYFIPEIGDLVLYDYSFIDEEHDHMGIVLEVHDTYLVTAEGNVKNRSAILTRPFDSHIRGYIRY